MFLACSRKEVYSAGNGNAIQMGWSPLVGTLVPMEIDTLREPKDLGRKVNSKGTWEPTEGTFASDSPGRNWTWRRGKYSHKGEGYTWAELQGRLSASVQCGN